MAFTLHNSEEVVANDARLSVMSGAGLASRFPDLYRTDRFVVAVVLLTCVVIAALVPVVVRRTVLSGALIANALTHIGQAIVLRGYNPGLVTAVVLVLPSAMAMAAVIHRGSDRTRVQTATALLIGAVLSIPAIVAALALSVVVLR